jgi:hypothetical protein
MLAKRLFKLLLAIWSATYPFHATEAAAQSKPDIVLHATVTGTQNQSYIELPFDVPAGVSRITVAFKYTGRDERTTLDLGIADPQRFRGWSGGNKDSFSVGLSDATPSYLPGAIVAGRWKLVVGVPNIRSKSESSLEAKIFFSREGVGVYGFVDQPLDARARWYRGDLHMHTGHSDGRCNSQSGKEVPCPVFKTVQAAADRGLDFVAITDHNTTSQFSNLRELQPYFDRLLLIPGREITTFQGHANVLGATDFIDFRVGSPVVPQAASWLESANQLGALVSINHPGLPSGESCMGCGWRPNSPVDMRLIAAVEAVNGGVVEGPFSGVTFWEQQLREGLRPTAIGGSDNHRPELLSEKAGSVGSPTTVVYARDLSVPAILEAIRAGHVFIDLTGSRDRSLELSAATGDSHVVAGDDLRAPSGAHVEVTLRVVGCQGSSAVFLLDGREDLTFSRQNIGQGDETLRLSWTSDGSRHWLRTEIRTSDGKLQLLVNPIYINYSNAAPKVGRTSSLSVH